MYYGNAGAGTESNGTATFEFFDDFEDYTLGDLDGQGGWYSTGNTLNVIESISYEGTKSIQTVSSTSSMYILHNITSTIQGVATLHWRGSSTSRTSMMTWADEDSKYGYPLNDHDYGRNGIIYNFEGVWDTTVRKVTNNDQWYKTSIYWNTTNWWFNVDDGANIIEKTWSSQLTTGVDKLQVGHRVSQTAGQEIFDLISVRKYTSTEPNTIIGTEEGTYHTMSNDTQTHFYASNTLADGSYSATFQCNDTASNINTTDPVYFYIDTTAPQVIDLTIIPTINSAGTNYTNSTFTINATVSDSGIGLNTTTCEYTLNNGSSWTGATYSGNNCTISLTDQPDQSVYNISMRITDNASNTGNITTIQVVVDGASPIVSIDPSSPICTEDTTPRFNLTVSDVGVGVDTCVFYIYVNGGYDSTNYTTPVSGNCTYEHPTAFNPGENIYIIASANDSFGNMSANITSGTVTISGGDLSAPSLLTPENDTWENTTLPDFDWSDVGGSGCTDFQSYHFQADNNGDFSSPECDINITDSNYSSCTLADGENYYWRVASIDQMDVYNWSDVYYVKIDITLPLFSGHIISPNPPHDMKTNPSR